MSRLRCCITSKDAGDVTVSFTIPTMQFARTGIKLIPGVVFDYMDGLILPCPRDAELDADIERLEKELGVNA